MVRSVQEYMLWSGRLNTFFTWESNSARRCAPQSSSWGMVNRLIGATFMFEVTRAICTVPSILWNRDNRDQRLLLKSAVSILACTHRVLIFMGCFNAFVSAAVHPVAILVDYFPRPRVRSCRCHETSAFHLHICLLIQLQFVSNLPPEVDLLDAHPMLIKRMCIRCEHYQTELNVHRIRFAVLVWTDL